MLQVYIQNLIHREQNSQFLVSPEIQLSGISGNLLRKANLSSAFASRSAFCFSLAAHGDTHYFQRFE